MPEYRVTQLCLIFGTNRRDKSQNGPTPISGIRNYFQRFVTEGIYIKLKLSQVQSGIGFIL